MIARGPLGGRGSKEINSPREDFHMIGEYVSVITVIQAWEQIKKADLIKGTTKAILGKDGCIVMMRNKSRGLQLS